MKTIINLTTAENLIKSLQTAFMVMAVPALFIVSFVHGGNKAAEKETETIQVAVPQHNLETGSIYSCVMSPIINL